MGQQEKRVIISIGTNILVLFYYANQFWDLSEAGLLEGAGGSVLIGETILYLIGTSIVLNIILQIIFSIIFSILTGDEDGDDYVSDERDKLIELKTMQIALMLFSIAFVGAIIHLYLGQTANITLIVIAFSMFIAHLLADFVKLFFYVRGF